ncbi:hypothetical protein ACSTGZ_23510, partial [Vibrio parahaemolyticus]
SGGNRMEVQVLQRRTRCIHAARQSGFDVPEVIERSDPIDIDGHVSFHRRGSSGEPTACALDSGFMRNNYVRDFTMIFLLGGA